jgi:hypothetical protein
MGLLQALNLPPRPPAPGQPQAAATPVTLAIAKPASPFEPGKPQGFTVLAMMSDGKTRDYTRQATWTSSNDALVEMQPGGTAKVGFGSGSVTITASGPGGQPHDSVVIKVQAALQDIRVTPKDPLTEAGKSELMLATAVYADGSTEDVTAWVQWSTEKPKVAGFSVNGGECEAKAKGTTLVYARDERTGIYGSTRMTVFAAGKAPRLVKVEIEPLNPEIEHGEFVRFKATGTFADTSKHEITEKVKWESSHPDVLAIDELSGLARPRLRSGSSLVRGLDPATGLSQSTTVFVDFPGILRIDVEPKDVRVGVGDVTFLTVTAMLRGGFAMEVNDLVSCTSADADIAGTAPRDTRITGIAAGKTTVEVVEPSSGAAQTVAVTVTPPVLIAIVILPIGETMKVGATLRLAASGQLSDLTLQDLDKPAWRALTPDLVDVDQDGNVTARKAGDAKVEARDRLTGIAGTVELTVAP